jgi:hypothetical protein
MTKRPEQSSGDVMAERLGRVFEILLDSTRDERLARDFTNLNITLQLAANVATTARTLELELRRRQQTRIMGIDEED